MKKCLHEGDQRRGRLRFARQVRLHKRWRATVPDLGSLLGRLVSGLRMANESMAMLGAALAISAGDEARREARFDGGKP